jgi:hypothetical protein
MEGQINNLKSDFTKIVDSVQQIVSVFEKLEVKISNITSCYVDLIETNKDKMYVFSLDSFRFQIALLDREFDENKTFFRVISNRIYCEYYKFCKNMCEYIHENYSEPYLLNVVKAITETNLPVYDAVDPKKEYGMCFVLTIHDNIIELFKCLHNHLQNKENELKEHSVKRKMGLNIDNFVFTFDYNNSVIRKKIKMFLDYMNFFHAMHFKNLTLMSKKLGIMAREINNDLNLERNANDSDNESDYEEEEEEEEVSIKKEKREHIPRKKNEPAHPKINSFLKKKINENEVISNEDNITNLLDDVDLTIGNVGLEIWENGKRKKKLKSIAK